MIPCRLANHTKRNVVAHGTIYLSPEPQVIHGVPLQHDCYRVSIDKVVKENACLPFPTGAGTTVQDALNSFVMWEKEFCLHEAGNIDELPFGTPDQETEHQEDDRTEYLTPPDQQLQQPEASIGVSKKIKVSKISNSKEFCTLDNLKRKDTRSSIAKPLPI